MVRTEMKRSLLSKDLQSQVEFIIEYGVPQETPLPKALNFNLTPDTLQAKEVITVYYFNFIIYVFEIQGADCIKFDLFPEG